ncbi:MAG: hypothetical protein ABSA84_02695 [Gammaproteobacteria bacterium]
MNSTNIYLKDQNQRAKTRAEFSNRLTKLLIDRGKCSARAAKLADPKFLAKLVNCSVVMARRYLLGQSIPTETNLKKISEWAKIESSWLLYGDNKSTEIQTTNNNLIDKVILKEILTQMRQYLLEKFLTDKEFENFIYFAVDIYENIHHLDIDFSNKVKMIELMVKSIDHSKYKKNKNTIAI